MFASNNPALTSKAKLRPQNCIVNSREAMEKMTRSIAKGMDSTDDIKGSCIRCRGHLAFSREALEQIIDCPHCGESTPLRDGSLSRQDTATPPQKEASKPAPSHEGEPNTNEPNTNEPNTNEPNTNEPGAVDALKSGVAGFARAAAITAKKAAEKAGKLPGSDKVKGFKEKAGKAASAAKDRAAQAAANIKSDPIRFRKRLRIAGVVAAVALVVWLGLFQPWKAPIERDRMWAERGRANSQFRMGARYEFGHEADKDLEEAIKWYEMAAASGHVDAQFNLAEIYISKDRGHRDPTKALNWYRKAAEQGDEEAKQAIGRMHYFGDGLPKDYAKAMEFFQDSKNFSDSQFFIAKIYDHGLGVKKDMPKAIEWYRKGAAQDHPVCLYNLGSIYYNGDGVRKDEDEALDYFQEAADLNYADGWNQVGRHYADGPGGKPRNARKAVEAFTKAEELGSQDGTLYLGACHYQGIGVRKDKIKGLAMMQKAAREGSQEAPRALRQVQQQQMMSMLGGMFDFWSSMDGSSASYSDNQMDSAYQQWKSENPKMYQR